MLRIELAEFGTDLAQFHFLSAVVVVAEPCAYSFLDSLRIDR